MILCTFTFFSYNTFKQSIFRVKSQILLLTLYVVVVVVDCRSMFICSFVNFNKVTEWLILNIKILFYLVLQLINFFDFILFIVIIMVKF